MTNMYGQPIIVATDLVTMACAMPMHPEFQDKTLRELGELQQKLTRIAYLSTILTTTAFKKPGVVNLIERTLETTCEMVREELVESTHTQGEEPSE